MLPEHRKSNFILTATHHGPLIVNRMDWQPDGDQSAYGVGVELLETGAYQAGEVDTAVGILELRRKYFGNGVVAIDGGANIGVHPLEWAKAMHTWGKVAAFEPQERIYYALAGNIALNNCGNAVAMHAALDATSGVMTIPVPNHNNPANFGGLNLRGPIDIGQIVTDSAPVRTIAIDDLGLDRLDLLKLDVEGMEMEALLGASKTISECLPVLMVEWIKVDKDALVHLGAEYGYEAFAFGQNLIFVHRLDKTLDHVRHLHRTLLREKIQEVA